MKLPSAPDLSVPNEVEPGKDISIGWNYYGDDSIDETVAWNVAVEIQVYISSWATVYTGKLSNPSYRMPYCDSIKVRARVTYSGYEASAWSSAVTIKAANAAPTVPSSISVPEAVYGGAAITIAWGPATDANNNLSGYEAWRAVNGGSSWVQIYQGPAASTTDTVPQGAETVMYRVRAYDSQGAFSGWRTSEQVDDATAGEQALLFAEWALGVSYFRGQLRRHGGLLYRCVQDHTSQEGWEPDKTAALWTLAHDPAEEWPAWSPPLGAHDAYSAGAQVSHQDGRWTSDLDGNVWEPGVYGWSRMDT